MQQILGMLNNSYVKPKTQDGGLIYTEFKVSNQPSCTVWELHHLDLVATSNDTQM